MARQKVISSLFVGLVFACVANAGFAQTQATTLNGTQTSGDPGQSVRAVGTELSDELKPRARRSSYRCRPRGEGARAGRTEC
jgi:hypothetical protein